MRHRRFFPTFDSLSLRIAPSGMDAGLAPPPPDAVAPAVAVAAAPDPSDTSDPSDDSGDQGTDPMELTIPDMTPYTCAVPTVAADPYLCY